MKCSLQETSLKDLGAIQRPGSQLISAVTWLPRTDRMTFATGGVGFAYVSRHRFARVGIRVLVFENLDLGGQVSNWVHILAVSDACLAVLRPET